MLAFKGVDLKKTFTVIQHAHIFWLAMSVLVSFVAFLSRAYRWNLLIEPLGYKPSLKNTTSALMVGYLANIAVPRLGEVSRCGSLSTAEKIPFEKLLGTVIVERIIDVLSLAVAMVITILLQFNLVKNFVFENIINPIRDKIVASVHNTFLLVIMMAAVIAMTAVIIYFLRAKASSGLILKIRGLIKGMIEGVRSIRDLKNIPVFIFHSIFIWVMYYFMTYLAFFALDATASLSWQSALLILVAGGIGMSAPSPGGVGTYHFLVSQALMIYAVAKEDGVAFATMLHGSQTLIVILFGAVGYIVLWFGNKKLKNAGA